MVYGINKQTFALIASVIACIASPTKAAAEPSTQLVSCRSGSCLLISGHRDDAAYVVHINGHAVTAEGKRHWRVRLPVETVRAWSAPFARTIRITLLDPETREETTAKANLPIGLLGNVTQLASLVVSIR